MADQLCRSCHQFYGSQGGLCSTCYKDNLLRQGLQETVISALPKLVEETKELATLPSPAQKVDRCASCSRRVGLMGFNCRCGFVYCTKHRLPEEHDCSFDHQKAARRKLTEDNPQVIAEKLTKI
mmetsp:Transcript_19889/g.36688  ORF Transcript_19889/g.36688 Transcript_19889/m.36688 type:complete len:124 (+) Transcript_19889:3796-4167(+)